MKQTLLLLRNLHNTAKLVVTLTQVERSCFLLSSSTFLWTDSGSCFLHNATVYTLHCQRLLRHSGCNSCSSPKTQLVCQVNSAVFTVLFRLWVKPRNSDETALKSPLKREVQPVSKQAVPKGFHKCWKYSLLGFNIVIFRIPRGLKYKKGPQKWIFQRILTL